MVFRTIAICIGTALFASSFGVAAFAADIGEEIKFEQGDKRVPRQPLIDHMVYYTKRVTCGGKDISILYQKISGYSRGTRFVGTCQTIFADAVDTCERDNSLIATNCFNKVIDYFKLADRHQKIPETINIDLPASAASAPMNSTSGTVAR
jgi:hypothetical protein